MGPADDKVLMGYEWVVHGSAIKFVLEYEEWVSHPRKLVWGSSRGSKTTHPHPSPSKCFCISRNLVGYFEKCDVVTKNDFEKCELAVDTMPASSRLNWTTYRYLRKPTIVLKACVWKHASVFIDRKLYVGVCSINMGKLAGCVRLYWGNWVCFYYFKQYWATHRSVITEQMVLELCLLVCRQ